MIELRLKRTDEYNLFIMKGELVRSNCAIFAEKMLPFTDTEPYIVIDMGEVDFMDSGGVGALVKIANRLNDQGKSFWLVRVNSDIRRMLFNVQMHSMFNIASRLEDILDAMYMNNRQYDEAAQKF